MLGERHFYHRYGTITVSTDPSDQTAVAVEDLQQEFLFDEASERYMIRYVAFPSVIGYDEKIEVAAEKAFRVLTDFIGSFLRLNGGDGFAQHLQELGFCETFEDDSEPWREVSIAEIASRNFTINGNNGI